MPLRLKTGHETSHLIRLLNYLAVVISTSFSSYRAISSRALQFRGELRAKGILCTMTEMDKFEAMINGEPEKRVGDLVGSYRLIRWLGRGAFADIYLGEHLYLKTQSAIKMLHVELSEKALKDFLNEARAIAQLEHPHIVSVLDYGEKNGIPFLVMTYAAKGSLRQRFPEGTHVPLEQIVPLVQQMASALDYAHQHKLIHRDVKPENMLVGAQDQVLLSDFGFVLVTKGAHTEAANSHGWHGPVYGTGTVGRQDPFRE